MFRGQFNRFSFQAKVFFSAAFVGTLSLVLVGGIFIVQDGLSFRKGLAAENQSKAGIVAHACASAVVFRDPAFADRVLIGLTASPEITTAAIFYSDGTRFAEYIRSDMPRHLVTEAGPLGSYYSDDHLDTTIPIYFQELEVGTITLRTEVPNLASRVGNYGLIVAGIAFLSLIISLRLARSFFRTLMKPIQELESTTKLVTLRDDYSLRAEKFGDDELGRLTDAFNAMLSQIEERESALRESENRFGGLLNRLGEAVFRMTVPDGVFEYCSPAAESVFGYPAKEFTDRPGILQSIIHPESAEFLESEHKKLLANEASVVWEYKIIDPTGKERWIQQTNVFEIDQTGNLTALQGCCTDITARHRAAHEKKQMEYQINQSHKLEALGTLAGGIAHDFNNILGSIMGYAELATMKLAKDDPAQDYLTQMSIAVQRATSMVRKILTFSRHGEQGKMSVKLNTVVEEALTLIRPSLLTNVTVSTSLSADYGKVMANSSQIQQIVMNLCTNAAHAMENQGGSLEVALTETTVDENNSDLTEDMDAGVYLQLRISDTGTGIAEGVKERIFEPFFTTKPKDKGAGMGLTMVYGIVRDHGGNILVDSAVGQGTSIRVLFPVTLSLAQKDSDQPHEFVSGAGRVLLVDDEEMLVNLVQKTLVVLGYEVVSFTDPNEALEAFRARPDDFDVLVTDLTMPGLTGRELAHEVKAIAPNLPIIICSGYNKYANQDTADSLGIFAFAQKPLKVNELGNLIASALDADHQATNDLN
ncbi:MAG: PAS domain S-box-containing protein [Candidatus Krumholzibacteriia bacterium]|jgi:PAS domain S-box-containing protein